MAYVSISRDLTGDVESKIRIMKEKQIDTLGPHVNEMRVLWDDPIAMELVWAEHISLIDVLPDKWCRQIDTIALKTTVTDDTGSSFSVSFNLICPGGRFRVPAAEVNSYSSSMGITVPPTHPLIQQAITRTRQVREINTHWRKISDDVVKFLRSAKSLNEALKLWPALALYIPESYIKKVAEKKAKPEGTLSKAQELLAGLDTDTITAAAVSSRMSTT